MLIPDKNYYLNDSDFLYIDYDYIYNEMDKLNKIYNIEKLYSFDAYDVYLGWS